MASDIRLEPVVNSTFRVETFPPITTKSDCAHCKRFFEPHMACTTRLKRITAPRDRIGVDGMTIWITLGRYVNGRSVSVKPIHGDTKEPIHLQHERTAG